MAGGIGSRFWPKSTTEHPKQFLDILGTGESLIQQTYRRMQRVCPAKNIYIVTNEIYRELTLEQLEGMDEAQLICEPARRNTAPCIAYASHKIAAMNPNANIIVSPADHLITKEEVFEEIMKKSLEQAEQEAVLLTIGIAPSRPDTGYGYIQYDREEGKDFQKVISFTEKPNIETAKQFLAAGNYSWNSGMFIWNVQQVLAAYDQYLPDMQELFNKGKSVYNTPSEKEFIDEYYPQCENISVDYGIMEKANNVEVISADFGWSDLGTWGSIYTHIPHDEAANAIVGQGVRTYDSSGNIVHVPHEKRVVIQGLDDCIIVEHGDTLLICKKDDEQKIKSIVNDLNVN